MVTKYTTGSTPKTSNIDNFEGNNTWVCIGDLGKDLYVEKSQINLSDEAIQSCNIEITPKGSLLYSFKLSIGKMAFAKKDLYTNEAIISIFPNKKINLLYYYYMLPKFMELSATENIYGAKMLNQKLIANTLLINPPLEEQQQIANYLDKKTTTIDTILANIQQQIEHLTELRKTLINDIVTGKVKITP